jgi:ABC-type nickel/cobalt efflux system permease component RcnA
MYLDTIPQAAISTKVLIEVGSLVLTIILAVIAAVQTSRKETREALAKKADQSALDECKKDFNYKLTEMKADNSKGHDHIRDEFTSAVKTLTERMSERFDDLKDLIKAQNNARN